MENWMEAIHLTEMLFVLSMLVAFFLLAVFGQRATWLATESLMATAFGLGFAICPQWLLGYQTIGTLKSPEIVLARLYGVTVLCTGFTWYRTKESRDATVTISLMMSRVFTSSTLLMAQGFAWYAGATKSKDTAKGKAGSTAEVKWGEQAHLRAGIILAIRSCCLRSMFAMMFMFPTGLWLIGNLLHLFRSHDFSQYPQHNVRLNNHLRLDAWFMLLLGAAWLAFPSQIVGVIMAATGANKVAIHIARSIGTLYVGEAIVSLQAPGFLHVRDKKALLLSRIVSTTLQLVGLAASFYSGLVGRQYIFCVAGVALPVIINSVVGYVTDGTVIYTVPTPKKNNDNRAASGDGHEISRSSEKYE